MSHRQQAGFRSIVVWQALLVMVCVTGCAWVPSGPLQSDTALSIAAEANPMFVPIANREFLWNQLVDTVDDYFKIEREERVRHVGNVLTEGRIDTFPQPAATLLEPWRGDSASSFERLHATLQTIRRRAEVRVIPTQGGYHIDVAVYKELEDLTQPDVSTAGKSIKRNESSLVRSDLEDVSEDLGPFTTGWIPLGREPALEQKILVNLRARLGGGVLPQQPTRVGVRPNE